VVQYWSSTQLNLVHENQNKGQTKWRWYDYHHLPPTRQNNGAWVHSQLWRGNYTGFPLFCWQNTRTFPRLYRKPTIDFPGHIRSPWMFKYKEKPAFTYSIQNIVHCIKFSMKQNVDISCSEFRWTYPLQNVRLSKIFSQDFPVAKWFSGLSRYSNPGLSRKHGNPDYNTSMHVWRTYRQTDSGGTVGRVRSNINLMMTSSFSSCLSRLMWAPVTSAIDFSWHSLPFAPHIGNITFLHLHHRHQQRATKWLAHQHSIW